MYGLCPACGSELDDEGNCWVCGYMAHFGSPDDYDYDDFNDEYLPWSLLELWILDENSSVGSFCTRFCL